MNASIAGPSVPGGGRAGMAAGGRHRFGGMKLGSAFFGWMTATGISVLLTAIATAIAAALGTAGSTDPGRLAEQARQDLQSISIVSALILAAVLFISYYCGGYVAGRMARFDGAKQGLAVWLWAVIMAAVVAILAAVAGSQFNVLANLNSFPRIPVNEGTLTTGGIILLIAAALITLAAAVLGGKVGMHYHRKIDHAEVNPQAGPST
jgi:hypothetical protein